MAILTYQGITYECSRVIKGSNYIRLLDATGSMIAAFDGVVNFANFELSGCSFEEPTPDHDCFVAVIRDDGTVAKGSHRCSAIANVLRTNLSVPASGWSDTAPYTQAINFVGLLGTDVPKVDIIVASNADDDTYDNATEAYSSLTYCEALDGQLLLQCRYDRPTTDFDIQVEVVR